MFHLHFGARPPDALFTGDVVKPQDVIEMRRVAVCCVGSIRSLHGSWEGHIKHEKRKREDPKYRAAAERVQRDIYLEHLPGELQRVIGWLDSLHAHLTQEVDAALVRVDVHHFDQKTGERKNRHSLCEAARLTQSVVDPIRRMLGDVAASDHEPIGEPISEDDVEELQEEIYEECRALLKFVASPPSAAAEDDRDEGAVVSPPLSMAPAFRSPQFNSQELAIFDVLREAGERMTEPQIREALEKRKIVVAEKQNRSVVATLKRFGFLSHRKSAGEIGSGYGLAEWGDR